MKTSESLLRQLENPSLSRDEQTVLRCQIAADFEHKGRYEAARDVLGELWRGVGQYPALGGLTERRAAEVLLRAGTLSSWLASAAQDKEGQQAAKDLISGSITRFEALGESASAAAAQSELGYCYWREGAYDEARLIYANALKKLTNEGGPELRAKILIRCALVESCNGRYNDALRILTESTPLFETSTDHFLKGKFHSGLSFLLTSLGKNEQRPDYIDRAILELTAAAYHFEQAEHICYLALAENNLGFLLYLTEQYADAHEHLNQARQLFASENNKGGVAQVDDTRARVLLAEGRLQEASKVIHGAVQTLSKGGEQGLLAEALATQGLVMARGGNVFNSQAVLRRAADVAEQVGAVEDAGRALLTLMEEHADNLTEYELLEAYQRADGLLNKTQDAETIARLRASASRITHARLKSLETPKRKRSDVDAWANFSLTELIQAIEARYIKRALLEARGSITHAARLLGLQHHASLTSLLKRRHRNLAHLRTPAETRKPSEKKKRGKKNEGSIHAPRNTGECRTKPRTATILHVEDHKVIADAVKETLELEGWRVVTCTDGARAIRRMASQSRYGLLIFDNHLPNINGLELVRYARQLPHRQSTPIIMLSASEIEAEARSAGVDIFLRKPQDIGRLTAVVSRLLSEGNRETGGAEG